jgi:hypothetical protein
MDAIFYDAPCLATEVRLGVPNVYLIGFLKSVRIF